MLQSRCLDVHFISRYAAFKRIQQNFEPISNGKVVCKVGRYNAQSLSSSGSGIYAKCRAESTCGSALAASKQTYIQRKNGDFQTGEPLARTYPHTYTNPRNIHDSLLRKWCFTLLYPPPLLPPFSFLVCRDASASLRAYLKTRTRIPS